MDVEHGTHAIAIYVRFRETGDSDIFFDKPLKKQKVFIKRNDYENLQSLPPVPSDGDSPDQLR